VTCLVCNGERWTGPLGAEKPCPRCTDVDIVAMERRQHERRQVVARAWLRERAAGRTILLPTPAGRAKVAELDAWARRETPS
jgi:hypothetical protein